MKKKRGFTLIELLVVIAIIALLMAIMMPALEFVRKQAKTVICHTLLKQWGLLFSMYADDHDNKFMSGWTDFPGTSYIGEGDWMVALLPYYQGKGIRFCPVAEKDGTAGIPGMYSGEKFKAWARIDYIPDPDNPGSTKLAKGSYGANCWIYDPPPSWGGKLRGQGEWKTEVSDKWRGPDVKGAGYIPVFFDCTWYGVAPVEDDTPPPTDNDVTGGGLGYRCCIDRHDGKVDYVFMDWTVRGIGLKQLWRLKWHRSYRLDGPYVKQGYATPNFWPVSGWMDKFPEY